MHRREKGRARTGRDKQTRCVRVTRQGPGPASDLPRESVWGGEGSRPPWKLCLQGVPRHTLPPPPCTLPFTVSLPPLRSHQISISGVGMGMRKVLHLAFNPQILKLPAHQLRLQRPFRKIFDNIMRTHLGHIPHLPPPPPPPPPRPPFLSPSKHHR